MARVAAELPALIEGLSGVDLRRLLEQIPALKEAAQFLLDNPSYRHQLDVAAGKGQVDGIISRQDLGTFQNSSAYRPAGR